MANHTKIGIVYDTVTGKILSVIQCSNAADFVLNYDNANNEEIIIEESIHEINNGNNNQEHFKVRNNTIEKKNKTERDKIDKDKKDKRMTSSFI